MPQVNITIDDVNPLIAYGPVDSWMEEGPGKDKESPLYFDHTRTSTRIPGATASFSFYGSAVWLFGVKGDDHGDYNVTLDGATSSFNGSHGNNTYQVSIFTATGLALGNHSVILTSAQTNQSAPWVELDYIVWQTEIGQATDSLISAVIDDTVSAFVYQPHGAWNTYPPNASYYLNGTGHVATADGAYVTFTFSTDSVELFGSVGTSMSNYSVQLDNANAITYNAERMNNYERVLLFFETGLSAGDHTLKVVNVSTSAGLGFSIDYANITGTTNSPPSANTTVSTLSTTPQSPHKHGASAGTIVAIAVSTTVALLLFIVLCRFSRHRRRNTRVNDFHPRLSQAQSGLPISTPAPRSSRSMLKSSTPPGILQLPPQLRSQTVQLQTPVQARNPEYKHRDTGVSLTGEQLPPPGNT
ncbi:hypothetical protein BD410DRAFT_831667 [Rickenella mellea]|uniref:Transmembrane protein n=1 Tax=Rickenella mellea TaxID=50990 RepID=A0A4Y7PQ57_9AGAM|nr:hypothetical protein BD410DRAFT_831667 [Rickenella mellea]